MDSMKSWAGIEEGKAVRSVCCVMQSVSVSHVLVTCCGIVLHTIVLEVPSCWSWEESLEIGLSTFRVSIVLRSHLCPR